MFFFGNRCPEVLTHSFSDGVQAELSINRTLNKFDEWATFPYGQITGTVYNFGSARLPSDTQKTYTTGTVTAKLGDAAIRQTLLAGVDYDETDYYARLDFNVAWGVVDFANPLPAVMPRLASNRCEVKPSMRMTRSIRYDSNDILNIHIG